MRFHKSRHQLPYYTVVDLTEGSFASVALECIFFKRNTTHFKDLEKAEKWGLGKMELFEKEKAQPISFFFV